MAITNDEIQEVLQELRGAGATRQHDYLGGYLLGKQYATLRDALTMMNQTANAADATPEWREVNETAGGVLYAYIEYLADEDGVPENERFWRD